MSTIDWVLATERVLGGVDGVTNRPLRQILEGSDLDPDVDFEGFALGSNRTIYGHVQSGDSTADKIQAAIAKLPIAGGVIDCRAFSDSYMLLDVDICGVLSAYETKPILFRWGSQEIRITAKQGLRSNHRHVCEGSNFLLKDANGNRVTGVTMFQYDSSVNQIGGPGNGVVTTKGSDVVTKVYPAATAWGGLFIGCQLSVFGFVSPIGKDDTLLNGALNNSAVSITVDSTTGFPSSGYIRIDDEVIYYSTKDATHFLTCTRGFQGTTAASHLDNAPTERCVYKPFYVVDIDGDDIVLDSTIDFASTGAGIWIGAKNISFTGEAIFDGNYDAVDDAANPYAIQVLGGRHTIIAGNLLFQNLDHGAIDLEQSLDSIFKVSGINRVGYPDLVLGVGAWAFGWNKRLHYDIGFVHHAYEAVAFDDRTVLPSLRDGPVESSTFHVRAVTECKNGAIMHGCKRAYGRIDTIEGVEASHSGINCAGTQWVTGGNSEDCVAEVGNVSGDAGHTTLLIAGSRNVGISRTMNGKYTIAAGNTLISPEDLPNVSVDRGDNSIVLTTADTKIQRFAAALTGNKTVTLPTDNVRNGLQYKFVRTGLGAFTLDIGGLKTIPNSTAAFVEVTHDGTAWRLTGYGVL